jgi:glycosyltransferase involved in cell wall biosynthesis
LKKILFISHEASRTGAPLILLFLLKWLNKNIKNIQFDVLLINGGAIASDFEKECTNTFVLSEIHKPLKFSEVIVKKILSKLGIKQKEKELFFFENIALNNYDLIYANSIVSLPIAVKIKNSHPTTKLLVHVHELNTIIKTMLPNFNNYINKIDKYIAVSNLVKSNLILNHNVDKSKVALIYEFGAVNEASINKNNEVFTVGASGYAQWRKGDDIFIQVAHYITKNYPNAKIKFVWVGNNLNNKHIIEADIEKLGLNEVVSFVGEQANPINYYKNFDIFLLPSREDAFPLVCIEAANLKKPILCFEKASGTAEVIARGGGFVVPYLDIEAMAKKVIFYYENPTKLEVDGAHAQELFSDFTPVKICPQLYESMASLFK